MKRRGSRRVKSVSVAGETLQFQNETRQDENNPMIRLKTDRNNRAFTECN